MIAERSLSKGRNHITEKLKLTKKEFHYSVTDSFFQKN